MSIKLTLTIVTTLILYFSGFFNIIKSTYTEAKLSYLLEKSLKKNYRLNKENFGFFEELLKDNEQTYSLYFSPQLIELKNYKNDIDMYDDFYYDSQLEGIYTLDQIIKNSDHWIFNKYGKTRIRFDGISSLDLREAILSKFNNEASYFWEILSNMELIDCVKIYKEANCVKLVHKSYTEAEWYGGNLYCLSSLYEYIEYSYVIGECETNEFNESDIEDEIKNGFTILVETEK